MNSPGNSSRSLFLFLSQDPHIPTEENKEILIPGNKIIRCYFESHLFLRFFRKYKERNSIVNNGRHVFDVKKSLKNNSLMYFTIDVFEVDVGKADGNIYPQCLVVHVYSGLHYCS